MMKYCYYLPVLDISVYEITIIQMHRKYNYTRVWEKEIVNYTWIHSITRAKRTFVISVKKLTLIGLNLNFPSTLDI